VTIVIKPRVLNAQRRFDPTLITAGEPFSADCDDIAAVIVGNPQQSI
jgi:hypothetical protein